MLDDPTDKKRFSKQITHRFLFAMDSILGNRVPNKVTGKMFSEIVGISASNLNRLRTSTGDNIVTVEAIARLCDRCKISPYWLITGQGEMYSNDELITAHNTLEVRLRDIEDAVNQIQVSLNIIRKNEPKK